MGYINMKRKKWLDRKVILMVLVIKIVFYKLLNLILSEINKDYDNKKIDLKRYLFLIINEFLMVIEWRIDYCFLFVNYDVYFFWWYKFSFIVIIFLLILFLNYFEIEIFKWYMSLWNFVSMLIFLYLNIILW